VLIGEQPLTPGIIGCRLAAPRVNISPRSFFRALVDPSAKAPRKNEGPGPHAPGPFGAQNGHSAKKSAEDTNGARLPPDQEILREYQATDPGSSEGLEDTRDAFNRLSDLLDRMTRT
jgi:hypothetical protein